MTPERYKELTLILEETYSRMPVPRWMLTGEFRRHDAEVWLLEQARHLWAYSPVEDEVRVDYPADWWEAFKGRWFPGWAKRRWPVRMEHKRFVARGLFPDYLTEDPIPALKLGSIKIGFIERPLPVEEE